MPFIAFIFYQLINVFIFVLFVSIIMSWLINFGVINMGNQLVATIYRLATQLTAPVLSPFQRIIPPIGGIDISPIFALIVLQAVQSMILAPMTRGQMPQLGLG